VKRLYHQMPEPKYVIAMGACTIGGGPYFKHGYHVVKGVDLIVPVDVYVPGCPPRPEALIEAVFLLRQRIHAERVLRREGRPVPPRETVVWPAMGGLWFGVRGTNERRGTGIGVRGPG